MKILLDTDICMYIIKNTPKSVRRHCADYLPGELGVSAISAAELRCGSAKSQAKTRNDAVLDVFFQPLEIVPFDAAAAVKYGEIRAVLEKAGTPIGPMDMLIAAHAVSLGLPLATNNVREYQRVPGLQCVQWM